MSVADLIRTKRAVREFADRPVEEEHIRAILNAGRRAQSSRNSQPWQFIAIRDRATLRELATCGAYAGHLAGAAFGVALVSPRAGTFDLGQAAAYLQLAAWELGIGSCIASLEAAKARAVLGVPDDQHLDYAISFGYPKAAGESRPPKPGGRKPFEEVVRWERW